MKETTKIFLNKLFNQDEEICVSKNQYANSSISQTLLNEPKFTVESQDKDRTKRELTEDEILLVSINPIKGDRLDENVTAFRSFLIELDEGDILEQKQYIDSLKMPYTVCIFSGNKSLHYGIVLEEALPDIELWRNLNQWILNIVEKADQQTKNPSRSIRFPSNKRTDGKKLEQKFVDIKERISQDLLLEWLSQYPDKNPVLKRKIDDIMLETENLEGIESIPEWVKEKLGEGVGRTGSRNSEWFSIIIQLAKRGLGEEEIIANLSSYFTPEHDFPLKEWKTIIRSATKRVQNRG